jgi:hypothetical protein
MNPKPHLGAVDAYLDQVLRRKDYLVDLATVYEDITVDGFEVKGATLLDERQLGVSG